MATQPVVETDRSQITWQLPDGRVLGYAEYGDPQGKPLAAWAFEGKPEVVPLVLFATAAGATAGLGIHTWFAACFPRPLVSK